MFLKNDFWLIRVLELLYGSPDYKFMMFHCRFLFCFGFWALWWFSKELENQKFFVEFKRFCDDITLLNLTGIRIVIGSVAVVLIIFLSVSLRVMDYVSGFTMSKSNKQNKHESTVRLGRRQERSHSLILSLLFIRW